MNKKENFCTLSKELIQKIEYKLIEWEQNIQNHNQNACLETQAHKQSPEYFEQASCASMMDVKINRFNNENKTLSEIRMALARIKKGTYGICEESGDLIEEERLLANPLARYSIEEQKAMEKRSKNN
jgi:DnaK suppressor protein